MAEITMYTSDRCPYCIRAKRLLEAKGVDFDEVHLRLDMEARRRLLELTGRYTVPQVLVGDQPIGGWDEMAALDRDGRLDEVLGLAA
jgi:glutaredoxin 3